MAAQDYATLAQTLYVTYFGRPADYFGLQSFQAQLDALKAPTDLSTFSLLTQTDKAGTTGLSKLVNSFNSAPEATTMYGTDTSSLGVSKFVEAIYLHVLNRAPDAEGWAFWVNEISSGRLPRATAAAAIADGATHNTSAQGLLDAKTVTNKIAVATDFTNSLVTVAQINGYAGDVAAATARGMLASVDSTTNVADFHATVVATVDIVVAGSIPSVVSNLTINPDSFIGTNGNDVVNAIIGGTVATPDTLTSLDNIDGGAGNDTLNVSDLLGTNTGVPAGVTVKNVENLVFRSVGDVTFNATASGITGVNKVAVTQAVNVDLTAGSATALNVANASGNVGLHGGSTQTVASLGGTAAGITLDGATGAVLVTDAAQGANAISIDNGTSVSVTAKGVGAGSITVGSTNAPKGAVAISATGAAAGGTAAVTMGNIGVTGGTKVSVIVSATSDASAAATDIAAITHTVTEGNITINGGAATTDVTVQQTASYAGTNGKAAVAGSVETEVVTFKDLASGKSVTIDNLTFTAAKDLTAAQVAAAFGSIAKSGLQGTSVVANGTYTGALTANYAIGAASGNTVTVTAAAKSATSTFAVTTTGTALAAPVSIAGATATTGVVGELAVVAGAVNVSDNGTKVLKTVSIDGFGAGSTVASNGLTTLNLANSDADLTVTNTAATSLNLGLNNVGVNAAAGVNVGSTYTTLQVTTSGADSIVNLVAGGVTSLTVAGSNAVDLSGATLSTLATLTVTGAAGVTADVSAIGTVTAVDTTATTGTSTVIIDGSKATFTGGAGTDKVTTSVAATKAISLGAGNDTLTLGSGVSSATAALNGGDGTDTIAFASAVDAAAATLDSTFSTKLTSFEKLGVVTFAADATVNLANINNLSYVTVGGGSAAAATLTFDKMAANGTVEITGADAGTVAVKLADASGSADVLNVLLKNGSTTNFGVVKAAGIETINLTATDSTTTTINTHTVDILAAAAKSIVVTGNANVTLTADAANVALASLDGSAMTGKLTASTNGIVAQTITGGSAVDTLTSFGVGDKLIGGAGNDILIVKGNLTTLTGGAGNDTFNVTTATTNVNSYATITDLSVGDVIKFADTFGPALTAVSETFLASKVSLGDTAVFQDFANAAITATAIGAISWFQVGGNTYVVENVAHGSSFTNGTDVIVKITGNVDLSHASFSASSQTLLIVA
jgi:S-layer protein